MMTVQIFTVHSEAPFCSLQGVLAIKWKSPAVGGPSVLVCHLSSVVWLIWHFENKTVKSVIWSRVWLLHQLRLEGAFSTLRLWCNELSWYQWPYSSTCRHILQRRRTSRMPRGLQKHILTMLACCSSCRDCAAGNGTEQGLTKLVTLGRQLESDWGQIQSVSWTNYPDSDRDKQDWILARVRSRNPGSKKHAGFAKLSVEVNVSVVWFSLLELWPIVKVCRTTWKSTNSPLWPW